MKKALFIYFLLVLSLTFAFAKPNKSNNYLLAQEAIESGNYDKAMSYIDKAIKNGEITAYNLLGDMYLNGFDVDQDVFYALDCYEIAIEEYKKTDELNSEDIRNAYYNAGYACELLSDYSKALDYYQTTLDLTINLYTEKSLKTAACFNSLARIYDSWGDSEKTWYYYGKAMKIAEEVSDGINYETAAIYNNVALLYQDENKKDEAKKYFDKAVKIWTTLDGENSETVGFVYCNIAALYLDFNETDTALKYAQKGLKLLKQKLGEYHADTAYAYSILALVYDKLDNLKDSVKNYQASLDILTYLYGDYHPAVADTYYSLGLLLYDFQEYKRAAKYLIKAFDCYSEGEDYILTIEKAWQIFTEITDIPKKYELDFYELKITALSAGIDAVEKSRMILSDKKDVIMAKSLPLYYAGIDLYANIDEKLVFYYSELLRSRGFLDEIGTEAALKLKGITEEEKELFKQYSSEIKQLNKKLSMENEKGKDKRNEANVESYSSKLEAARKKLAELDDSIGNRIPKYKQLRNPQPVDFTEAKKWCGKDRIILEYVLWNDKYANSLNYNQDTAEIKTEINSYCLVVTNKKVTSVKLDSEYDYSTAVQRFRELLIERKEYGDKELDSLRKELFKKLISPVLAYLPLSADNIMIVPDGTLSFIPFNILCTEDGIDLGDAYNLSFSPSVSVSMMSEVNAGSKSDKVLAIGNAVYNKDTYEGENRAAIQKKFLKSANKPSQEELIKMYAEPETAGKYYEARNIFWSNIPGTGVEINNLKNNVFDSKKMDLIEGINASEEKLKSLSDDGKLTDYSLIHFACHGYFDTLNYQMSSIVLSEVSQELSRRIQDGYLTLSEVSLLNINANLVNLSACQTGLAQIRIGDGMTGLSRSFFVAGARNVGVTLWSVDDEATCEFMTRMYEKVVKHGYSYRRAYSETKMEFKESDKWSSPYYWAAFVLYE